MSGTGSLATRHLRPSLPPFPPPAPPPPNAKESLEISRSQAQKLAQVSITVPKRLCVPTDHSLGTRREHLDPVRKAKLSKQGSPKQAIPSDSEAIPSVDRGLGPSHGVTEPDLRQVPEWPAGLSDSRVTPRPVGMADLDIKIAERKISWCPPASPDSRTTDRSLACGNTTPSSSQCSVAIYIRHFCPDPGTGFHSSPTLSHSQQAAPINPQSSKCDNLWNLWNTGQHSTQ